MTIQQRIFKTMAEKGITQAQLSKCTGISTSTISDWKKRNNNPSSDKICVIADCLGVSISYLLGVDDLSVNPEENTIVMQGNSFAAGYVKNSTVNTDMFGNKDVTEAYNKLSPTEKLEIQIEILKKADTHA